ncbi:MAG: hypothetical protein KC800_23980, partial [Candidatus Eremiobacteraeota bacterium]|nr:hypothetical protein [Candidatus Eremiobacteraeota bacterium]
FVDDGWFVLEVTDSEGKVDLSLAGREMTIEKPAHVSDTFPNHRWRRWLQNLILDPFEDTQSWRNSTALYLANRWIEENSGRRLKSYRLLFVKELTPPPGQTPVTEIQVLAESSNRG